MISKIQGPNVGFKSKVHLIDNAVGNRFEKLLGLEELKELDSGISNLKHNRKRDVVTIFPQECEDSIDIGLRVVTKDGGELFEGFSKISRDFIALKRTMLIDAYRGAIKDLKPIKPSNLDKYRIY
ncbi:MAG: hypothetical protein WCY19_02790 [Candidatus Gastranaerophilaceae bacterium]